MAQAKYTIMVPKKDNLGQPLKDLATAAHQHLFQNHGLQGSHILPNAKGNWEADPQEPFDLLITSAEDTPETDSIIKSTASYVAEVANQWSVFVMKDGGKVGHTSWLINNPSYREGQGADPSVVATPV